MGSASWRASGLVTLLTDFGLVDPYVGVMKGVLWGAAPALRAVVDLAHGLPHADVARAAFFVERSRAWFPPGTVHVAVVDPGVGSAREILLVESGGSAFVAPDNGLLDPLREADPGARAHVADVERLGLAGGSRTFHGRDRFAPLAARLVQGEAPASLAAARAPGAPRAVLPRPERAGELVRGRVLFADRFGNLVTNVAPEDLGPGPFAVLLEGRPARRVGTYAEGAPGELVCLLDSYGRFELALGGGDAARELGLGAGATVEFREARGRS